MILIGTLKVYERSGVKVNLLTGHLYTIPGCVCSVLIANGAPRWYSNDLFQRFYDLYVHLDVH